MVQTAECQMPGLSDKPIHQEATGESCTFNLVRTISHGGYSGLDIHILGFGKERISLKVVRQMHESRREDGHVCGEGVGGVGTLVIRQEEMEV